ncbi:serine carboxypeptidase [Pelomyxa schiedti]|nr:serine carboxypeptidase [Pelomyxa schiedti]
MGLWSAVVWLVEVTVATTVFAVDTYEPVVSLPGIDMSKVPFKMYSGYVSVGDPGNGHQLFFMLAESASAPAEDPVVLKLGGGPGCSGLGEGFYEMGPFVVEPSGDTLRINEWSYNSIANVLFLESPCGVGFSQPTDPNKIVTSDSISTEEAFEFLSTFFSKFRPDMLKNELWITGGSYCGHYIPLLASYIIQNNGEYGVNLNFIGFTLGNPLTDLGYDQFAQLNVLWTHTIITTPSYEAALSNCNLSAPTLLGPPPPPDPQCTAAIIKIKEEMGSIDRYELYANPCIDNETVWGRPQPLYEPCIDSYVDKFQRSLNVNGTVLWESCSQQVFQDWSSSDFAQSMLPVWETLFQSELRMLVYGGDVDGVIPPSGTRAWIDSLSQPVVSSWKPWLVQNQVAGYVTYYETLTFATVKNAGHMVAYCQPERAFHMWSHFIKNIPL